MCRCVANLYNANVIISVVMSKLVSTINKNKVFFIPSINLEYISSMEKDILANQKVKGSIRRQAVVS